MTTSGEDGHGPSPALVLALRAICLLFAAVGLLLTLVGNTALFAPWRDAAAQALLGEPRLPTTLTPFASLTDGILGGSIVGRWLAAAWLVRYPLAAGERWAWWVLMASLLAWFSLDSGMSLALGAGFNTWMINLIPLLLFGGALLRARGSTSSGPAPPPAPSRAWSVLTWVCLGFAAFGVVVATASHTALFAPYHQAIAGAWFGGGALPADAIAWMRFTYALIGATFLAHFLVLGLALRFAPGQRWVLEAVAVSMEGWFLVDATASAMHEAWFNVWMIDLPSLLAVMVPWWWARRGA